VPELARSIFRIGDANMLKRALTTAAALAALSLVSHAGPSLGQEKKQVDEKEKASMLIRFS
jgi:hypothetical protein